MKKTNPMRILEKLNINFEINEHEVNLEHLDAVTVSKAAGLNPEQVYKTIVMSNENKEYFVFCLPSILEINLKKAKKITNSKKLELIKPDKLRGVTGYIRGGCSPLGMIKKFPTFLEELALLEDSIYISAGLRGVQIRINPKDLVKATKAELISFTL